MLAAADTTPACGPSSLPRLRERAGLSVADVAAALVERFGLSAGATERAAGYLERLERGELEPARVSRRLLDALGELLGAAGAARRRRAARRACAGRPPAACCSAPSAATGDGIAEDLEVLGRRP